MPFEAAKAVAATFCYHMRFALTLVFGTQFPEECLKPDHEGFGEMIIDESIIRFCSEEAELYRQMAIGEQGEKGSTPKPTTPVPTKQKHLLPTKQKHLLPTTRGNQDHYESDSDREASYPTTTPSSVTSSLHGGWSPLNTPHSINSDQTRRTRTLESKRISPRKRLARGVGLAKHTAKANSHGQTFSESMTDSSKFTHAAAGTNGIATRLGTKRDNDVSSRDSSNDESIPGKADVTQPAGIGERELTTSGKIDETLTDEKAAQVLLSLRMGQASLSASISGSRRLRKRRASA